MPVVDVRHLTKSFCLGQGRRVEALRGLSLQVNEGEIFGLLGQNGAGKSTLVRCLLSLCRPSAGEAFLFGQPAHRPELRRSIGYLPEDHRFPEHHSAASGLLFFAHLSGLHGADARRRVAESLSLVGLSDWAGAKARELSKGLRPRLAFAQAILHRPKLLFLDEPTDGLDPLGRLTMREVLGNLRAQGTTVFLNSHILAEVEMTCDRVLILHQGRALREGTIEGLTREAREYALAVAGDPARAMEVLGGKFRGLSRADQAIHLLVDGDEDVDRAVDLLRAAGIGIRSLRKKTLEEVYLAAIGGAA